MDFGTLSRSPYPRAEHPDCVVDGLLECVEIALLLKRRSKRRSVEGADEHRQGLFVIDLLKLIDEIAQLDLAIRKGNALE
ncbi:hypothetical protein QCM77_45250 [Bradyrhizobium sp. SSUT18]|uniref:hypothetical protein n=1 Tax=Bradyrhizobium sp. SSUT18 TaxID=3040602 RepID=UPI00244983E7|nr:hypothetical protein [Bradyrhizobium sp. SSUT18]MDH2406977.1 hypothetical protein [Bradyrhizobium sp. SSUT18]